MSESKRWIVIKHGCLSAVTKVHLTLEQAKLEAERLACKEKTGFGVFEMVAYVCPQEMPVKWEPVE